MLSCLATTSSVDKLKLAAELPGRGYAEPRFNKCRRRR
jgi:hypothetical protein